jgi:hypothetical protein
VIQTVHTQALVTRISTCAFQIKTSIPVVSRPLQIAITPDGLTTLVTSFDNAVNFIDLTTNQVRFTLMTDPTINPHGIAILPDRSRAYITSFTPGVGAVPGRTAVRSGAHRVLFLIGLALLFRVLNQRPRPACFFLRRLSHLVGHVAHSADALLGRRSGSAHRAVGVDRSACVGTLALRSR